MKHLLTLLTLISFYASCTFGPQDQAPGDTGPKTVNVELDSYQSVLYVSDNTGSDETGDGSAAKPWETIQKALAFVREAGSGHRVAVLIGEGGYSLDTFTMIPYVDLFGGFDPRSWKRDIIEYPAELNGDKKRRIIIGADNAVLDGFVIKEGRIRGKGAGLYCSGVSPTVTNNVFIKNQSLAPAGWNPKFLHEISNDGGAVYCENGASPVIENNCFVGNTTENGRGAAIAFHSHCNGRIANNLFLKNRTGLNDPLRSSDGGAVSIFDWSSPLIENNVFLNNEALAKNDAGGLFVALWSAPVIRNNVFVGNLGTDDAGALFIGGQEHRYDAPLDPLPPRDQFYIQVYENCFVGNRNPSGNSGVTRFTMEGRGEFVRNVTAYNTGVYFQRSEVLVEDNLILDDFLMIETKEGLKPSTIRRNVIGGDFNPGTDAVMVEANTPGMEAGFARQGAEGMILTPDAVLKGWRGITTRLLVSGSAFRAGELAGRVVKADGVWGVVKSNTRNELEIWGDMTESTLFQLLPEYRLWIQRGA